MVWICEGCKGGYISRRCVLYEGEFDRNLSKLFPLGPLKTPQILELSGVGDENLLNSLGIQTKIHLPGVGENLQVNPLDLAYNNAVLILTGLAIKDPTLTASDFLAKPGVLTLGLSHQHSMIVI